MGFRRCIGRERVVSTLPETVLGVNVGSIFCHENKRLPIGIHILHHSGAGVPIMKVLPRPQSGGYQEVLPDRTEAPTTSFYCCFVRSRVPSGWATRCMALIAGASRPRDGEISTGCFTLLFYLTVRFASGPFVDAGPWGYTREQTGSPHLTVIGEYDGGRSTACSSLFAMSLEQVLHFSVCR